MTASRHLIPAPESDLDRLAREIRSEVRAADLALRDGLGHAIRAGKLLTEAKARLQHGEWIPWLNGIGLSRRTASHYMRLGRNGQIVAHLDSVADAVAWIAEGERMERRRENRELGRGLQRALARRRGPKKSSALVRPGPGSPGWKLHVAVREVRRAIRQLDAMPSETIRDSGTRRIARELPRLLRELADRIEQGVR